MCVLRGALDEPRHGQNSLKQNIASHDLERLNQLFIGGEMKVLMSQNRNDRAATIIGCKEADARKSPYWECGQSRDQADAKPCAHKFECNYVTTAMSNNPM
jgi:hypothetical protein